MMANKMRDRLVELMKEASYYLDVTDVVCNRVADHLIENGVIVPPCKVGQQVWYLRNKTEIITSKIEKIILKQGGLYIKLSCNSFYETSCNSIGKTIFFSVQELEQKLKEMRGGNDS